MYFSWLLSLCLSVFVTVLPVLSRTQLAVLKKYFSVRWGCYLVPAFLIPNRETHLPFLSFSFSSPFYFFELDSLTHFGAWVILVGEPYLWLVKYPFDPKEVDPFGYFSHSNKKNQIFGWFKSHLLHFGDPFACLSCWRRFGVLFYIFFIFIFWLLLGWSGWVGGLEMNRIEEEQTAFEIAVVVPKRNVEEENEDCNCWKVLVDEFTKVGLIFERVQGVADEFIKVLSSTLSP